MHIIKRANFRRIVSIFALALLASAATGAGCSDESPDTSAPQRPEIVRTSDWQGALLYIADQDGPTPDWGSIRVYDNVSGFVEQTVEQTAAAGPRDMFVTPEGSAMYVAGANGKIDKFRWDGNSWIEGGLAVDTPADSLSSLVPGPDGKAYATGVDAEGRGVVFSLDPSNDKTVQPVLRLPSQAVSGISWSENGTRFHIAGTMSGTSTIYGGTWPEKNIDQSGPIQVQETHQVVTSPDGRFVYVMGRGVITKVDAQSYATVAKINPALDPAADYYDADFSADGRFMFVTSTLPGSDGTLYVVELATNTVVHSVKHISVKPNGIQRVE